MEGPVERQVPPGIRVQFDMPVGTVIVLNGAMFAYSGYFLYHSIKGLYKLNKET